MSDSNLFESIAKAQSEMTAPPLDSVNPHYRSKFSSIAAVREHIVPVLAKHGVAVFQELRRDENGIVCDTVLRKGSLSVTVPGLWVPATKGDAHGYAAASTYCRRISLQTALCLVGEEDTDGNDAIGTSKPKTVPQESKAPEGGADRVGATATPKVVKKDYTFLKAMTQMKAKLGDETYYRILGANGYEHADDIPADNAVKIAIFKALEAEVTANTTE